jgi:hypothetical protein
LDCPHSGPSPGQLSSDAGLLIVRQFDEQIGLTRTFANALDDPRAPALTEHTFPEMVRARVDDKYGVEARLQTCPHDLFDTKEFPVNVQPAARFQFDFFQPLPIQIQVADAPLTSDAGLLPLRQFDHRIGLTKHSPPCSTTHAIPTSSNTRSWNWSVCASSASSPATKTRTTTTRCVPTPSSN